MPSPQRFESTSPSFADSAHTLASAVWDTPCQRVDTGYWPAEQLRAFTLCMASHGMSVSTSMMLGDRRYALETLACAHAMNDVMLRELAMELFRHFERVQSGVPTVTKPRFN